MAAAARSYHLLCSPIQASFDAITCRAFVLGVETDAKTFCAVSGATAADLTGAVRRRQCFGSRRVVDRPRRSGLLLFLAGRLPVHFSTVFPLERRDMVMGGAAERRLQASHRHRCTWWRAMVPPWCIHSLVRSLVCRVDRRPAAASDLHRWLGARCELPHEDDCVSSAGSGAQQTTC